MLLAAIGLGCSKSAELPEPPMIQGMRLLGAADLELRQGGTGTLIVSGTGLAATDAIVLATTSGPTPLRFAPSMVSATEVRADIEEPHGALIDSQRLFVEVGGFPIETGLFLTVTAITASPAGDDSNRGTTSSPFRTWSHALTASGLGDTVWLGQGDYPASLEVISPDTDGGSFIDYACNVPDGVNVIGQSDAGSPVRILDDLDAGGVPLVFCGSTATRDLEIDGFTDGLVAGDGTRFTQVAIHGARRDGALLSGGASFAGRPGLNVRVDGCGRAGVHSFSPVAGARQLSDVLVRGCGVGLWFEGSHFGAEQLLRVTVSDNLGAGIVFAGDSFSITDSEVSRNGARIPDSPGIQLDVSNASPNIVTTTVADNSGDGIQIVGDSAGGLDVESSVVSGNRNGLWFDVDAGSDAQVQVTVRQCAFTSNRAAGIRIGAATECDVSMTTAKGNGVNLLVDADFGGLLDARSSWFDAHDGGSFADADATGAEVHGWIDAHGVQRISDAGFTTGAFDWDADAGEGPFNYKLLSDAGRIQF